MKAKILIALVSILASASISAAEAYPTQASIGAPTVQANYYGGFFDSHRPWFSNGGYGYGYHHCHRHHRRHWWF